MSNAKFTPGPWEARPMGAYNKGFDIYSEGVRPSAGKIAHVPATETKPVKANALLIAAAPELLAALQTIVESLADEDEEGLIEHVEPMIAARRAIAKARGEA
jgi:hypothetical protein